MKEIIEIANQVIIQLDKIIKQELDKISTDKRNEFDARMQTFEIVLDESFNHMGDSTNKHCVIYAGTRNLVTEAMTDSKSEVIPDQNNYRDILRGMIVYGCAVAQPLCGAKAFVTTATE